MIGALNEASSSGEAVVRRWLILVLAVVLAFGVASPAFGGPSPLSLAKRALRTAKHANKTANTANKTARAAGQVALLGALTVHVDSGEVLAAPNDFARFSIDCPAGYVPSGYGPGLGALEEVAVLPVPTGYIGSFFNPSDTTTFSGSLDVICVRGRWDAAPVSAKPLSRREATSTLDRLEAARIAR
jgi:hypothetical protein